MTSLFNAILTQTMYYTIAMFIGIFVIAFFQRGFLVPFFRVKASRGKFALGKARGAMRDYFVVAEPKDGFLTFKDGKEIKKICIPSDLKDKPIFYRCLGIVWFDFHEEKNGLVCSLPDFSTVSGFDAIKFEELYTRCLYKPSQNDNTTKIILILLVVLILIIIIEGILIFTLKKDVSGLAQHIQTVAANTVPPPSV